MTDLAYAGCYCNTPALTICYICFLEKAVSSYCIVNYFGQLPAAGSVNRYIDVLSRNQIRTKLCKMAAPGSHIVKADSVITFTGYRTDLYIFEHPSLICVYVGGQYPGLAVFLQISWIYLYIFLVAAGYALYLQVDIIFLRIMVVVIRIFYQNFQFLTVVHRNFKRFFL